MKRRIHILADKIPWFGQHSGYHLLARYLDANVRVVSSRTGPNQIRLGKLYARLRGWRWRNDFVYAAAEWRFALDTKLHPSDVQHVLYGEGHHYYFEHWHRAPSNVIATLHHPPAQWRQQHPSYLKNLRRLRSALVLYQCDVDEFEKFVGRERVRFVRHGVDTDFFQPPAQIPTRAQRILFVGQNGRNFEMLERVVTHLAHTFPELRFDFVVRDTIRTRFAPLTRLKNHPAIQWHEKISDTALLALYQNSTLLLLPLDVCGATNAMVEALACGLPIVTTQVGGVTDYGGGTVYPPVKNNDDDAMCALVQTYLQDAARRAMVARASRAFAETTLAWHVVAREHLAAYETLAF